MTMLIRSPQEIMRETRHDLVLIEFLFPGKSFTYFWPEGGLPGGRPSREIDSYNPPGRQEIIDWISAHLPGTPWEPLGTPERSGFLLGGYDGRICVHFDDAGLAAFCAVWERDGRSIDPRFQCVILDYTTIMANDPGPPDADEGYW